MPRSAIFDAIRSVKGPLLPDDVTIIDAALDRIGTATYDPPSLADGAGDTTTVTVTGAELGDFVVVSFSNDLQGILVQGYVSATDTVSVRFQNETTGTIDLASGTLTAAVYKRHLTI